MRIVQGFLLAVQLMALAPAFAEDGGDDAKVDPDANFSEPAEGPQGEGAEHDSGSEGDLGGVCQ